MSKQNPKEKKSQGVPTGALSRNLVSGKAAAQIGTRKVGLFAKKVFTAKEKHAALTEQTSRDNARILFDALTKLKGTALKLAQMLTAQGMLPDSYNEELKKASYQVPPLNRAVVRRVIKAELGKYPEELFASFEPEAFAAASLGQVHRAIDHNGNRLAVKIQYPGIGDAVGTDIRSMKLLLSTRFTGKLLKRVVGELEARLQEEVDYLKEAQHTEWFRDNLSIEGIKVPQVFSEFTSRRVITTEYIGGLHLDQWLETSPSQEQRNRIGQLLYDSFIKSVFEIQRFHADPNPGNFIILPDGTIALVDFGCVKVVTQEWSEQLATTLRALIHEDEKKVKESFQQWGVSGTGDDFDAFYNALIKPALEYLAIPMRHGKFDMSTYQSAGEYYQNLAPKILLNDKMGQFTTENVFFDRQFQGLYRILTLLGATVRFDHKLLK